MKALLLAAGFGTRLRPLTESIPKCLVPIAGRPLLGLWLENLMRADIDASLVNTHYLQEQVVSYLDASQYRNRVVVSYEKELRGTAGTLLANLDFFGQDDVLLIHADIYCEAELRDFVCAHNRRPAGCLMSMMTFRTQEPSTCGIVELDEHNVVVGFHEKSSTPPGNLASGAVYLLTNELLMRLKSDFPTVKDFSTEVIHHFLGHIYSHEVFDAFLDVGTPENYLRACKLATERVPPA